MRKSISFAARLLAVAFSFSAFAQNPEVAKAWRIAVVSDMNQSYGSKQYTPALVKAIEHIRAHGASLVLSTGDMVAGQKSGLDYAGMWNAFHDHVTRPLEVSQMPILPSPGNHDAANGFRTERQAYARAWLPFGAERLNGRRAPADQVRLLAGVPQNFPFNYAVTMGPALFIALDATVPGRLIENQIEWLEDVLARSAAYKVKMVFGHFPLLPFTFDRAHDYLASQPQFGARLEELLEKHDVDLFLSGHHHAFYPGSRRGKVRYVSVPLLGTGSRYLLTRDRLEPKRSVQAFLYIDFNERGEINLTALKSPSMTEIRNDEIPAAISIPREDARDCKGCRNFPAESFLDPALRSIYERF